MKPTWPIHPDISDILARKVEGRREAAQRTFGEKIAWAEEMRERLAPLKRAREEWIAAQRKDRPAE
jgi:hypothetical protein